eukprot:5550319-Amphidinium_carterae.5
MALRVSQEVQANPITGAAIMFSPNSGSCRISDKIVQAAGFCKDVCLRTPKLPSVPSLRTKRATRKPCHKKTRSNCRALALLIVQQTICHPSCKCAVDGLIIVLRLPGVLHVKLEARFRR